MSLYPQFVIYLSRDKPSFPGLSQDITEKEGTSRYTVMISREKIKLLGN